MNRTKLTILTMVLCMATAATAQIRIPGTNVSFSFPEDGWMYLKTVNVDKNTQLYLYSYADHTVLDNAGDTIIPYISIYVRHNYTQSTYDFVFERYMVNPYQSLDEYTNGLPGEEGIGYIGAYHHEVDNKDYKFRMIYFKDKNNVIEVRLETSIDTFDDFNENFMSILKTFSTKK